MGCKKLKYQNFSFLEIVHSEKRVSKEKKRINYYPFGLKHKGYNNTPIGPDHKYGFNGVEEEDALGLDMLTMDLRQYDPAIARWTSIDPVTNFDYSTYNGYDNNPVYWADPSGASVTTSEDGNETKFTGADAIAAFKIIKNSLGSSDEDPPTEFVTEDGKKIVKTDDGSDEIFVIKKENVDKFIANLKNNIDLKRDKDKEENEKLGNRFGFNIEELLDNIDKGLPNFNLNYGRFGSDLSDEDETFFRIGYDFGFYGKDAALNFAISFSPNSVMHGMGKGRGKAHKNSNRMHAYDPQISSFLARFTIVSGSPIIRNGKQVGQTSSTIIENK